MAAVGTKAPLVAAALVALALNALLFAGAALLSREGPVRRDMTSPVPVRLVTVRPEALPPPEPRRIETPPPVVAPPMFAPEISRARPAMPGLPAVKINLATSFLNGAPAPGDGVFEVGDLDTPPRATVRTEPVYPLRARQRGIEGRVRVKLLVGADGDVRRVEILEAEPPGTFEDAVRQAASQWRFEPGRLAGKAVASWVVTDIEFKLD